MLPIVAPHPGAWIEILVVSGMSFVRDVAPHPGAWIEIPFTLRRTYKDVVAPHPGAWIEILIYVHTNNHLPGRTPPGCVD